MKITVNIPKRHLYAPLDFGKVLKERVACGVKLKYTELDFVQFESGKTVFFDAYSSAHKFEPFGVECGMVAFPFFCECMTDIGDRVAYAGLRFSETPAEKWKLLHNGDISDLNVSAPPVGIPITSGVCCFSDAAGYDEYAKHVKDDVHPLAGLIVLDGQTHARVELYGRIYAVFSTGWGDGRFNCYAGIAADGTVTAVIADFGMIEYPPDDSVEQVTVDTDRDSVYMYDPNKSEELNNIDRWTFEIEHAATDAERIKAYAQRGYAYHSANDTDKAIADYLAAVRLGKSEGNGKYLPWSVYDNAAEIFCARSDYDSAIRLMTDALNMGDSFYTGAFVRLIDLYGLTKQTDAAKAVAEKMLAARPNDPVAFVKYAECCVAVADYTAAADAFETLATQFGLYENLFDEASCYIELNDLERATEALERHPAKEYYEQYWYYKAYIEFKRKRMRRALRLAEKSRAIDGEYMPALYLLIDAESVLNEYHAAATYAEEYKKLRPDNEYGYSVCAEAQLIIGNLSESAKNYYYLYTVVKQDDRYAALAAMTCARSGEKKRSREMLRVLRHKRSAYYNAALYGANIHKHGESDTEIFKIADRLKDDADFLLSFARFLLNTNNIIQATHLLEGLRMDDDAQFEVTAQRIRTAEKIGDRKHFLSFLNYYISEYFNENIAAEEISTLAKSFITTSKHNAWVE